MVESKKSYTWKEIEDVLKKELKKTKHIMTFGTIGSLNVEHDIDTIITKKPKSKTSDFYKEIHNLFDDLNDYLTKKYSGRVIRLPSIGYEKELLTLSKYEKGDLVLHTMVYVSYTQLMKDWGWAIAKEDPSVEDILKENYNCLVGSIDDLFSKEFQKERYYDFIFIYLNLYDRINSNYAEGFLINVMNSYYDYLFRKRLGLKTLTANNKRDVRKIFYKLCDIVDKLEKTKKW